MIDCHRGEIHGGFSAPSFRLPELAEEPQFRSSSHCRIALLWTTSPKQNQLELPTGYGNLEDWRKAHNLETIVPYHDEPQVLRGGPEAEPLDATFVGAGYFDLLGVQPAIGRFFTSQEADRSELLVVLGYGLWQWRFGGSAAVIGKLLRIEDRDVTVVGVLPQSFRPLSPSTQLWMPYTSAPWFDESRTWRYSKFGFNMLAKLRPGVTLAEAQAEMNGISAQLGAAWPDTNRDLGIHVVSLLDQVTRNVRLALALLLGAVAIVLLIACTDLGNLLLARATGREREMAVRASLGASRTQLIAQLLTESVVLALLSAGVGYAAAVLGLKTLLASAPASVPRLNEVSLDARALLFTIAISLVAALLFGLTPALRLSGKAIAPAQRSAGARRSARRLRDFLVVVEYALAVVLLAGAGLLLRSLSSVLGQRFQELLNSVETLPGIEAAGGISRYFQANAMRAEVDIVGKLPLDPSRWTQVNYDVIAGHYLQALRLALLEGRYFSSRDAAGAPPVAIVNQAFVHAFLPEGGAVGRSFRRGGDSTAYTIVGVIGDTRRRDITAEPIPEVLWPHTQRPWGMNLAIRTAGDPLSMVNALRSTIHRQAPTAVIRGVTTLDRKMDDRIAPRRFQTWLLSVFAALALFLATLGIYGLMHYSVSERIQEIGMRIALGAQARDVSALVLKDAARLAAAGLAAGLAASLWVTRLLASVLYGVSTHDPAAYAGAFLLLFTVAPAASAIPARRATRCDPLQALRQE